MNEYNITVTGVELPALANALRQFIQLNIEPNSTGHAQNILVQVEGALVNFNLDI